MNANQLQELHADGFILVRNCFTPSEVRTFLKLFSPPDSAGRRGMLADPQVLNLAKSEGLLSLVRPCLGDSALPIRAIFFDKSPWTNWLVPWHQDLTIAVRQRVETPGFGPWSRKDGIPHVQPPVELLARMLTLRIHLDDAHEKNGALRVIPGSHRRGRLASSEITDLSANIPEFVCHATAGDVLVMRPLLLHASSRSLMNQHRRILHIEYAGFTLPSGLDWHAAA